MSSSRDDDDDENEDEDDAYVDDSYHDDDDDNDVRETTNLNTNTNTNTAMTSTDTAVTSYPRRHSLPDSTPSRNTKDNIITTTIPSSSTTDTFITTGTTTTTSTAATTSLRQQLLLPSPPMSFPSERSLSTSILTTTTTSMTTETITSTTNTLTFGSMQSVVLLLRNYKDFGLAERVSYHFNALQHAPPSTTTTTTLPLSSSLSLVQSMENSSTSTSNNNNDDNNNNNHSSTGSTNVMMQTPPTNRSSSSLLSIPETMMAATTHHTVPEDSTASAAAAETESIHASAFNDATVTAVSQSPLPPYGIVRILESISTRPLHTFTRRQKKDFKRVLRQFNDPSKNHHEPTTSKDSTGKYYRHHHGIDTNVIASLPFQMYSQTRLYTTYEITNIALIIDASSTLTCCNSLDTTTMTNSSTATTTSFLCPMDRLLHMFKIYLYALIEPISTMMGYIYQPQLAITVLAVYPTTGMELIHQTNNKNNNKCTSVLVRDYHVTDRTSMERLCQQLEDFCYTEVENEIATRMMTHNDGTVGTSRMSHLMDAGYVALSSLSDHGRPLIVIGTDSGSVQCSDNNHIINPQQPNQPLMDDIPIIVLDCSSDSSSVHDTNQSSSYSDNKRRDDVNSWMRDDRDDIMTYSLHRSDDSDKLYNLCQVTGGAFWDIELLQRGATTRTEQVDSDSLFHHDSYFAFRKHTSFRKYSIQCNAIQWYTLFQLSPLSPRVHDHWGHLPPPRYLSQLTPDQYSRYISSRPDVSLPNPSLPTTIQRQDSYQHDSIPTQYPTTLTSHPTTTPPPQPTCITFSNYVVNPIPIHEILLMRIKEGYRAKQYGQSNMLDSDRISILFTLLLPMGITIRYELSFIVKSHPSMTGSAHIKIEVAGDTDLVLSMKTQYLNHPNTASSLPRKVCTYLRSIQKEDLLQAYISPLHWTDQLSTGTTPFVSRLGTLSSFQHKLHFVRNEFDCVCVGHMPWDDDDFLSEFRDNDDGSQHLMDAIQAWSTQTIIEGKMYIKQTHPECGVGGYAIASIVQSPVAPRLYTVILETFCGVSAERRHNLLISIQNVVHSLHSVDVLPKQLCQSLIATHARWRYGPEQQFSHCVMESLQNHASWDLLNDPELTPLLIRRRKEIGKFNLLESCDTHGLFARIYDNEALIDGRQDPGNLAQYHFAVLGDKLVVDFYMEFESGVFFPFRRSQSQHNKFSTFHRLVTSLKKRDQECGHALRCRTMLLQAFDVSGTTMASVETPSDVYRGSVLKLLGYSSKVSVSLRFFYGDIGEANIILYNLTKESLLLQTLGPKVAELPISPTTPLTDSIDDGHWFIIEYDKYTSSIVHFSNKDTCVAIPGAVSSSTCRELTFYTFGISDLYNRRDDVDDDALEADHISEHLQVTEFCDSIQLVHERNYSYAAYLSLTKSEIVDNVDRHSAEDISEVKKTLDFTDEDVSEVMKTLEFVKVGQVAIVLDTPIDHNESFLMMFDSILHPFPRDNSCFYMDNNVLDYEFSSMVDEYSDLPSKTSNLDDADEEQQSVSSNKPGQCDAQVINAIDDAMSELDVTQRFVTSAPMFVRFLLNDAPLTSDNMDRIQSDSTLSVLISVFKEKSTQTTKIDDIDISRLPSSHLSSAAILSFLLNAYVAELTLNRLRSHGSTLERDDVLHATMCMRNARNILTCTVDLYFFSQGRDTVVKASDDHFSVLETEAAFDLLVAELKQCQSFALKSFDSINGYMIESVEGEGNVLMYWCFLKMQAVDGTIVVDVYHPNGLGEASELIGRVVDDVTCCCHRVNQLLLLTSLKDTRLASKLLIPEHINTSGSEMDAIDKQDAYMIFQEGHFACPIAYETSFELFHRLAPNPMKVVRSLETYVLQNFAVSNRPEIFVYRDEYGSVFYMKLSIKEPKAGNNDVRSFGGKACIDFVVYGIGIPGSSITEQLRSLLHKHLLSIAVETLTTILTKNPRFHWRQLDIQFIKLFRTQVSNSSAISNSRLYKFPASTFDPGMVALFFRQNLCGSTFFHPLLSADGERSLIQDVMPISSRNYMHLQPTDLVFFYNASSSDLDPSLQSESTLTSKGSRYAMQTGSGLAIIEVSLLNCKGQTIHNAKAAIPVRDIRHIESHSIENLTFVETVEDFRKEDELDDTPIYIRIDIADTALKTDILYNWVLLSMNQAIMAWNVERQLERIQNGLTSPLFIPDSGEIGYDKKLAVEKACPGLPILLGILEQAQKLPHPAALMEAYDGVVRSSMVASVTIDLLEKVVLDQLQTTMRMRLLLDKHYKLVIIRSSRSSSPRIVKLQRDNSGRVVVYGTDQAKQHQPIIDSPIDCPEYTIFFHSPDFSTWMESSQLVTYPKLFKEVSLGYEKSAEKGEFAKLLSDFKQKYAFLFRRSIAFIFSVKRNRRKFLAYNWSNSLFKRTTKRLAEMEDISQKKTFGSVQLFNYRCLSTLSPISASNAPSITVPTLPAVHAPKTKDDVPAVVNRPSIIRSTLPPTIRRPKLVGKSIEGSAVHAQAKSRARASAPRFKGITQSNTPISQRKHNTHSAAVQSDSINVSSIGRKAKPTIEKHVTSNGGDSPVENDTFHLIRREFEYSLRCSTALSINRFSFCHQVSKKYWCKEPAKPMPESLVSLIFSMAPISWVDISAMLPYPKFQVEEFLHSFGNTLITCIPELTTIRISNMPNTYWLSGKLRTLKLCRSFVVLKITVSCLSYNGISKNMVNLEGRLLTLPRKIKLPGNSFTLIENVSTGLDKLANNIRIHSGLQGQLLDHCALLIERTMKSLTTTQEYNDVVSILRPLVDLFPLRTIMKSIRSNYKCYKATIILTSYADPIVSAYNGIELYNWLSLNVESTNLINCGASGLCLKKVISIKGTQSICFLKFDESKLGNMCLYILCRTQGRDLYEFMFRDDSNVAVSLFSNIAIEAAGIAYSELRTAAFNLHRDSIWNSLVKSSNASADLVVELLQICTVTPLNDIFVDVDQLLSLQNDPALFDPNRLSDYLTRDSLCTLIWESTGSDGVSRQHLYYLHNDDCYLMASTYVHGVLCRFDLIERARSDDTDQRMNRVVEKIMNSLVYFIWSETCKR